MTHRQFHSIVFWTVILIVCLVVGFALLIPLWRPPIPVTIALVALAVFVIVMLARSLFALWQVAKGTEKQEKEKNL